MQQGESTVINHKLASHLLGLKSLSSKVDYLWRLLETVAPAATSMHGHTTLNCARSQTEAPSSDSEASSKRKHGYFMQMKEFQTSSHDRGFCLFQTKALMN